MLKINGLNEIKDGVLLAELGKKKTKRLQRGLSICGYPVGAIDGLTGPKTRNANAELKMSIGEGNPHQISSSSIKAITEKIDEINCILSRDLTGREAIKSAIAELCNSYTIGMDAQIAYVLATAQWETAHTFEPVREAFWLSEKWRRNNLRYYPFYGRGFVQLTWKNNYKFYSDILDQDIVELPDRALDPSNALFVLVHGFKLGVFTGRKITDFINDQLIDFIGARACINGNDKALEIKMLADDYLGQMPVFRPAL